MNDLTVRPTHAHKPTLDGGIAMQSQQPRSFLRLPVVKQQCGLGRTSIYSAIKAGTFPAPLSIGARAVAWLSEDIDKWIESRIKASRGAV